jgi:Rubisco LSMT substrate-binding
MYVFCLAMTTGMFDANSIPEPTRSTQLQRFVKDILQKRLEEYDTSVGDDERILQGELSLRERMAVEVRLGEKRILVKALERVDAWFITPPAKRVKTTNSVHNAKGARIDT